VNVFSGGLAAGGLLIVLVAYARSLSTLSASEIGRLHAHFHPPTHRWMRVATIIGAVTAGVIAAVDRQASAISTRFVLAGVLGAALQAVLSRFWVVPWSEDMIGWADRGPPDHFRQFVRRWTLFHAWRVVGAVGAFACYLFSLLVR
jgi:hypothetical protein